MTSDGDSESFDLSLTVDGRPVAACVASDKLLLHALREDCGVTAPKWGCGTGDCGACSVMLNDSAIDSCLVFAAEAHGATVCTSAGVAKSAAGTVVVEELARAGAVQCGICTPGFVVAISAGIRDLDADPDHEAITRLLSGNICRCTGYLPIIAAVRAAARRLNERSEMQGGADDSK